MASPAGGARRPALVIFDCDGVLVDSEPIANRVLAQMLTEEGLPTSTEESRTAYQGRLMSEMTSEIERRLGRELPLGWIERYERRRAQAFTSELRAVPGAREVLEQLLRVEVQTCVASQGRPEKTALSLALTGLEELLPEGRRFSARQVARGKPHPDLFLHAARTLGVDPDRCAVVEDTTIGVRAALSAGMRAIGYAADSDAAALRDAGAEAIASLLQLPGLLSIQVG